MYKPQPRSNDRRWVCFCQGSSLPCLGSNGSIFIGRSREDRPRTSRWAATPRNASAPGARDAGGEIGAHQSWDVGLACGGVSTEYGPGPTSCQGRR